MKVVLTGKFIAWSIFKKKISQKLNDLTLQLKALKKEQNNSKCSRRQEIIKIRAEINEIETKETIQKIDKQKSCFFEKVNKIDETLPTLTKGEKTQITKICDEKENIMTDTTEIYNIMRSYFENLYSNKNRKSRRH